MSSGPSDKTSREGEADELQQPRSNSRTFQKTDGWYFMTRERVDVGPFATDDLAQRGVQDYAGFSIDADRVYLDAIDSVPDESGIELGAIPEAMPISIDGYHGEVFDRRRGDEEPASTRNTRIFESNRGWYFVTREGGNVGPFPARMDVERGVADYVSFSVDAERLFDEA